MVDPGSVVEFYQHEHPYEMLKQKLAQQQIQENALILQQRQQELSDRNALLKALNAPPDLTTATPPTYGQTGDFNLQSPLTGGEPNMLNMPTVSGNPPGENIPGGDVNINPAGPAGQSMAPPVTPGVTPTPTPSPTISGTTTFNAPRPWKPGEGETVHAIKALLHWAHTVSPEHIKMANELASEHVKDLLSMGDYDGAAQFFTAIGSPLTPGSTAPIKYQFNEEKGIFWGQGPDGKLHIIESPLGKGPPKNEIEQRRQEWEINRKPGENQAAYELRKKVEETTATEEARQKARPLHEKYDQTSQLIAQLHGYELAREEGEKGEKEFRKYMQTEDFRKEYDQRKLMAPTATFNLAQGQKDFTNESKMRSEFRSLPEVKDFTTIEGQKQRLDEAMKVAKSGGSLVAVDQSLITILNKMLDPASVVRESEYARTARDMALLSQIKGKIDKLTTGGAGLTDVERKAIYEMTNRFYSAAKSRYNDQVQYYTRLAKQYNIDPENIVRLGGMSSGGPSAGGGLKIIGITKVK